MNALNVENALRAPRRHWLIDGMAELLLGALEIAWGLAIAAQALWPSRLTTLLAAYVPPVLGLVLVFAGPPLASMLGTLKERVTYPRVGYVRPLPPRSDRRWIGAVVGAVAAAVVVVALHNGSLDGDWLPAVLGTLFAAGFVVFAYSLSLGRFWVYALVSLAAGAVGTSLLGRDLGIGAVLAAVGVACTVGGGLTLARLLRLPAVSEEP